MSANGSPPLLEVRGLVKHYPLKQGVIDKLSKRPPASVRAVDGVDFAISRGKTLALVGESGCGKTTTGRCVLFLQRPTAGEVRFNGDLIDPTDEAGLRKRRSQ